MKKIIIMMIMLMGCNKLAKLDTETKGNLSTKVGVNNEELFKAVNSGDLKMIKLLLEKGVDVNCKNTHAYTPLLLAAYNNNTKLIKMLIEKGADVNCKNKDYETPLLVAAFKNNKEIVKMLVEKGANIFKDDYKSLLKPAIENNNIFLINTLLEKCPTFNADNNYRKELVFISNKLARIKANEDKKPYLDIAYSIIKLIIDNHIKLYVAMSKDESIEEDIKNEERNFINLLITILNKYSNEEFPKEIFNEIILKINSEVLESEEEDEEDEEDEDEDEDDIVHINKKTKI